MINTKKSLMDRIYKNIYIVCLTAYVIILALSLLSSSLESVSYSGFFLKHFNVSLEVIIPIYAVSGLVISVLSIPVFLKNHKFASLIKIYFSANLQVLIMCLVLALSLNLLDKVYWHNFIFSLIHVQPKLLYKVVLILAISLLIAFSLAVKSSLDISKEDLVDKIGLFKIFKNPLKIKAKNNYKITILRARNFVLFIYSSILLIFAVSNSVKFINKFNKPDEVFLKDFESKYARTEADIFDYVEKFFPQTSALVKWCNNQEEPVQLVTFDPEVMWLNYEGMTRVFLTNCYIDNIYSLNKSRSYVGEDNLLLVSIAPCDPNLEEKIVDPDSDHIEYFKVINNQHICRSQEIIPNLYLYKEEGDY